MSWGDNHNGGPEHEGLCPECGKYNYSCNDGLCDECEEHQPIKCHDCGDMVEPEHMTEHGCCILCLDLREEEKTEKILYNIEMYQLWDEMKSNFAIINKHY